MQLALDLSPRAVGRSAADMATAAAERGNPGFTLMARAHVLDYLKTHGPSAGEDITSAGAASGIRSKDGRAWGSVFAGMSGKQIRCVRSDLPRRFGHGSSGGKLWELL